jgi:hypothetical protein
VIGRAGERDPLDLLGIGQRECRRPPTAIARIERIQAVGIEVVDDLTERAAT